MNAQSDLDFALKMYGEAMVKYATTNDRFDYDMMVIWQNKAWMAAKAVAEETVEA